MEVKAYLEWAGERKETRRFSITFHQEDAYQRLREAVECSFPKLDGLHYSITWTDQEGDRISVMERADVELLLSHHNDLKEQGDKGNQGVVKIHVEVHESPWWIQAQRYRTEISVEEHPGVLCCCCHKLVRGFRYTCMVCLNFDLCPDCEYRGVHPSHDMLRISSPKVYPPHFLTRLHRLYERSIHVSPTHPKPSTVGPATHDQLSRVTTDEDYNDLSDFSLELNKECDHYVLRHKPQEVEKEAEKEAALVALLPSLQEITKSMQDLAERDLELCEDQMYTNDTAREEREKGEEDALMNEVSFTSSNFPNPGVEFGSSRGTCTPSQWLQAEREHTSVTDTGANDEKPVRPQLGCDWRDPNRRELSRSPAPQAGLNTDLPLTTLGHGPDGVGQKQHPASLSRTSSLIEYGNTFDTTKQECKDDNDVSRDVAIQITDGASFATDSREMSAITFRSLQLEIDSLLAPLTPTPQNSDDTKEATNSNNSSQQQSNKGYNTALLENAQETSGNTEDDKAHTSDKTCCDEDQVYNMDTVMTTQDCSSTEPDENTTDSLSVNSPPPLESNQLQDTSECIKEIVCIERLGTPDHKLVDHCVTESAKPISFSSCDMVAEKPTAATTATTQSVPLVSIATAPGCTSDEDSKKSPNQDKSPSKEKQLTSSPSPSRFEEAYRRSLRGYSSSNYQQLPLHTRSNSTRLRPTPRVAEALQAMQDMGFTDDDGWLTQLLVMKHGDISQVLDLLTPVKK